MMEVSRNHGLGLRAEGAFKPEAVLSTAPASPTDSMPPVKQTRSQDGETSATSSTSTQHTLPPEHSTLAQLSFGPATQQTVTTVTKIGRAHV